MRRGIRVALYALGGLAVAALLCAVAVVIIVQTSWFREKVRERIVYEVEKATGGRVELGAFDFDWHTLTASVRNLVIHGTEEAGEAPLFRANLIRLRLRIVSLVERRFDLASVFVNTPQVNLIVYPDGRTNLPRPKVARKPGRSAVETALDLAIQRFNIVRGTVRAQMRSVPLNLDGENLRARIYYQIAPARYQGSISFRSLDVTAGNRQPLPIDVDTQFSLERDRLEISQARFGLHQSTLYVTGAVTHFVSPEIKLDYSSRVNVEEVAAGFGLGPLEHRGTIAVDGHATFSRAAGYAASGTVRANGLAFRQAGIRIQNIRLDSGFAAVPGRLEFKNLAVRALNGGFDGRAVVTNLRDFRVEGSTRGISLQQMRLIREVRTVAWNGTLSGPVTLSGEVRDRQLTELLLNTRLAIEPAPGENPVHGSIDLTYDHAARLISFGPSTFTTRFSQLDFSGALGRRLDVAFETTNIDDTEPAIAMFTAGPPPALPVKLINGTARFRGVVSGPLREPAIQGHASAVNVVLTGRQFDRAEADVSVASSGVRAQNVAFTRLGMRATGAIQVGLAAWKPVPEEPVAGEFTVRSKTLADVLAAAGVTSSLEVTTGNVGADAVLGGTIGAPEVSGHAQAVNVVFYGQPLDRVQGDVRYTSGLVEVRNAQLNSGSNQALVSGRFEHRAGDWRQGRVQFQVSSAGINLGQLKAVGQAAPGTTGRFEGQLAGEFVVASGGVRPGALNGQVSIHDLDVNGQPLGSFTLTAATQAQTLAVRLSGELAGAKITGTSTCNLEGEYPLRGRAEFTLLQFGILAAALHGRSAGPRVPINGSASGAVDFSGSATNLRSWKAFVDLSSVEFMPPIEVAESGDLTVRNSGAVVLEVDSNGARVRQARFRAKDTDLSVSGQIGFRAKNPWDLRVQGGVNLALLRDFESRLRSAGALALDVTVRGALTSPEIYGRIDLKNASVNLEGFPNGVENANGAILLYRDRATIDTLTAESGGGKVSFTGFISFAEVTTFHLQAKATDVRVRYPEDVSSTASASLTFTGTTDRSLLAGDVTITRVGFNLRSDLASLLARSAQPIQVPAQPGRFRQGLRFDVHIVTAAQARFETKLTKDVQADADLRLRGDATRPVLLGRVTVNQGQVNFFGTQYTINFGQVLFVNATKIEPTVNMSLETRVRGVDVTLQVSGPVDRLNMSYTSDPPLPFNDVVALLATGREPSSTPGVVQTTQQASQGYQQGVSSLLAQAIASPISGRLQRFFGVSRLKINPLVTGLTTSNAAAQITLEQNITSNLTFTYITDLSRAQAQTIQMEWDVTGNWSAVAVREENGLFGIDFLYRKQLK